MIKVARYLKSRRSLSVLWSMLRSASRRTTIARRFCSKAETARYGQIGLTELCRWPQWVLECPPCQGYDSGMRICSVIAASLGKVTHTVLIVLVTAMKIVVDSADDGA